jgi:hypothetical protein
MEQIIETFAESVSGFILLSLKLQEQNQQPSPALKPAAEAVVSTAATLTDIAKQKAQKEYTDYAEIQADILDCADRVHGATSKFAPALNELFTSPNRAAGWMKLVQATQAIASQTSRLLLVVFGAEHRRLVQAGMQLLETCTKAKSLALMTDADLTARANDFVETVNRTSSDLVIFAAYVQARAKEVEGPKHTQMTDAVAQFNNFNAAIVDACNGMLKAINTDSRKAFIKPVQDTEKLTRLILDLLAPIEGSDIFALVDSFANQRVGSLVSAHATMHSSPLHNAALELKKELQPIKVSTVTAATAKTQAGRVDRAAGDFAALARTKVTETSDADRRKRMQANLVAIEKERGNVAAASAKFVAAPGVNTVGPLNAAARAMEALVDEFMADVVSEATLTVPGSGAGLSTRTDAVDAAAESAKEAIRRLQAGMKTMNDDELAGAGSDASKKLAKLIEHLRAKEAAAGNAAHKAQLADKIRLLLADNSALIKDTNAYLANRKDAAAAARLNGTCETTIGHIDGAVATVRTIDGAAARKAPATFEDRIDEAGRDIRDGADEFHLLPKPLKDLATELADLIIKLADCARKGDRQGMIEVARQIDGVVKRIKTECRTLANNCRDPQLKDNILTAANAMTNFGTQLKIVAAVKAAGVGKDPTAENQLVACCQGISTSTRTALYNCQTAKATNKA